MPACAGMTKVVPIVVMASAASNPGPDQDALHCFAALAMTNNVFIGYGARCLRASAASFYT